MARARPVALLVALVLAALVACGDPPVPRASTDVAFLQVVAHHDDDLLFMNPDVRDGVRSGRRLMTVFLTAGESDVPDPGRYSASRQAGARAAYARMAGVADRWQGSALPVADGQLVERYVLEARPQVQLVFLNLPDNANPRATGGRHALMRLWNDRSGLTRVDTVVPTGGQVGVPSSYTRGALLRVLVELMAAFQPTVLRTQDGRPDPVHSPRGSRYYHPDHVTGAWFAEEAARIHSASSTAPRLVRVRYRDYNTDQVPANLGPAEQQDKVEHFGTYARHDDQIGGHPLYDRWSRRMYYRWPRGTSWVGRAADGRLHAFAVVDRHVLGWRQSGDRWEVLDDLDPPGGALATGLAVAAGPRGLTVCGRRLDTAEITCHDDDGWTGLGSPDHADPRVGTPALAARGDGRLVAFVRDATGGISRVDQDGDGGWGDWTRLGGSDVQDGLSAVTGEDGEVEVFAATTTAVVHWDESGWDQSFPRTSPAGPPVAVTEPDGSVTVVHLVADTGEIAVTTRRDTWSPPVLRPGPGGPGGPAAVFANGAVAVVGRDAAGTATVNATGGWVGIGGTVLDHPAAAVDGNGRLVVLAIGPDGRLHTTTQDERGQFAPWQAAP
ncbi:PIG-L family deacetylase [Saccharothrix deserti]|uniref:PIG-L family deacetylase n=1 Tax=Saccharothrix deserti TaxID=2593674 RepID=UPI00131CE358|nr:PIG-L family deacetylase [Saccharothrix deserti]